jgi:hypothetical protein
MVLTARLGQSLERCSEVRVIQAAAKLRGRTIRVFGSGVKREIEDLHHL